MAAGSRTGRIAFNAPFAEVPRGRYPFGRDHFAVAAGHLAREFSADPAGCHPLEIGLGGWRRLPAAYLFVAGKSGKLELVEYMRRSPGAPSQIRTCGFPAATTPFRGSIHTLHACCLRFAAPVTGTRRKTRYGAPGQGLPRRDSHPLDVASFAWRTSVSMDT